MDTVPPSWYCAKLIPGGDCVKMGSGLLVLGGLRMSQTGQPKDEICLFFPGKWLLPLVICAYSQDLAR